MPAEGLARRYVLSLALGVIALILPLLLTYSMLVFLPGATRCSGFTESETAGMVASGALCVLIGLCAALFGYSARQGWTVGTFSLGIAGAILAWLAGITMTRIVVEGDLHAKALAAAGANIGLVTLELVPGLPAVLAVVSFVIALLISRSVPTRRGLVLAVAGALGAQALAVVLLVIARAVHCA